jgi:hypothetical protein
MTTIIINNFDNSTDLCENWGWYVDLEPVNEALYNKKYRLRKFKPIYIIDISEEEENKKNDDYDDYDYYMNENNKYKIKNSLETIFEEEEENNYFKNNYFKNKCNILRVTSVTIITGLFICIIIFAI